VPDWFGFESTTTSGMIALASGLIFTVAWLFGPYEGIVTKWRREGAIVPEPEPIMNNTPA
jgi:hypothetical protein